LLAVGGHSKSSLLRISPQPPAAGVVLLRITPEIISVLDYPKGFGHGDLVTLSERNLDLHVASPRHRWDRNGAAKTPSPAYFASKLM
jgi:hypothetical protein